MNFKTELLYLKDKIEKAKTTEELDYLRITNEKKYWWTSILIAGLFYGLNGKIGKMIITWIISAITWGIYGLYVIYTSYRDEKEFNAKMELYIYTRKKELEKSYTETKTDPPIRFKEEEDDIEPQSIKISSPKDSSFSENNLSFKDYEKQVNELENLYQIKEKLALELIEKRFAPPQLTYDRFINVINSCNQMFYKQAESALNIIKVATKGNEKVENELKNRVDTLKSIIEKIDELTNELAINLSNSHEQSNSDEVKDLLEDMQILVDSVKEYE